MEFSSKNGLDFEKQSLLNLRVCQGDNLERREDFNFLMYCNFLLFTTYHTFFLIKLISLSSFESTSASVLGKLMAGCLELLSKCIKGG